MQARYLGVVLGDLVDVAVWGNVPCVACGCRYVGNRTMGLGVVALSGNTCRTRMGGGSTEHVHACSGGVVVVALKDLVACEFIIEFPPAVG